jgi:hypothetical protein
MVGPAGLAGAEPDDVGACDPVGVAVGVGDAVPAGPVVMVGRGEGVCVTARLVVACGAGGAGMGAGGVRAGACGGPATTGTAPASVGDAGAGGRAAAEVALPVPGGGRAASPSGATGPPARLTPSSVVKLRHTAPRP